MKKFVIREKNLLLTLFFLQTRLMKWSGTSTDLCLTVNENLSGLILAECDVHSLYQKWYFTHYNPGGLPYIDLI